MSRLEAVRFWLVLPFWLALQFVNVAIDRIAEIARR